ncbi:MAG: hypothetical protein U1E17_09520 [Geminicoccaceae bacterium]
MAARPTRSWPGAPGPGAAWRYPDDLPEKVHDDRVRELDLIGRLRYAPYFLTVHDIVRYAESEQILRARARLGRQLAVCYVLGITAIDPARIDLLFERFVSAERDELPDIDVDFEHEQRERVIQHVFTTYGHAHAALVAGRDLLPPALGPARGGQGDRPLARPAGDLEPHRPQPRPGGDAGGGPARGRARPGRPDLAAHPGAGASCWAFRAISASIRAAS